MTNEHSLAQGAVAEGGTRRDLARSASLADRKQRLLAPAIALSELTEMLLEDARHHPNAPFRADLEKITRSAGTLLDMVRRTLEPSAEPPADEESARRLRHDLRTPLNHVIGLCELWLEAAEEEDIQKLVGDLEQARSLGKRVLTGIDDVLRFHTPGDDGEADRRIEEEAAELARLAVDSLEPLEEDRRADVTGTLLVVDDNDVSRDVLVRRLLRQGHTVAEARNGREALEQVRARPFDLVLLDIIMPEMDGFQVLRRLKADETLRYVPVIMISAFNDIDSVARCIEIGAEDYLPKPFNPTLLRARISACLEKKRLRDREQLYLAEIQRERERADGLLHVILPGEIVKELKETNTVRPRRYEHVAVMFCDIVGFTPYCDNKPPEVVVQFLQGLIESWEESALRHEVEKIKTIGDAFMAASGLLTRPANPVLACLRCGLEMIAACQALPVGWNLRVGIHAGTVVAGVIGRRQYLFDLWGDTVNTAARMESHGVPGAVTLSGDAWVQVADLCRGEARGPITVKGKGEIAMYRFFEFKEPGILPRQS
ncbi:MAG: response regulator [Gemmataceae bacterium]|nr:response regulator [Gemmataceae bacterium]